MDKFYNIPDEQKTQIYQATGEKLGLPAYAIEKDWWVVQAMKLIFSLEVGKHLVFKGGTSLSKAWELIDRFSEDIDLAVDRNFLGFQGSLSKNKRTQLRKAANSYIQNTIYPELKTLIQKRIDPKIDVKLEPISSSDQDPIIIGIYYQNLVEAPGYIQPRVQIEIGCRSLIEPYELKEIISFIDNEYPEAIFAQAAINIPTVLPTRTFLEKVFLLHEEFQKPQEKIRVERLSRHLYDIHKLSKSVHSSHALNDTELYQTIVNHRIGFTKLKGVNYELHQPQFIQFIPPENLFKQWENDYKNMQEEMIHEESLDFDSLITELRELQQRINDLPWNINIDN